MSLIKQLWLGMILLLLLALGGSFIISLLSASEYLRNQLKIKNIDDANSLALSLSQMEKDSVDIELIITAQFDAGHYEYIMFNDQHKKPVAVKRLENQQIPVPIWFANWVKLDAAPGVALIQDGWQQYGSLIVKSHSGFALESLWQQAKKLLEWYLFTCLVAGLLGIFVFRRLADSLEKIITQAEAISERRFIRSPESNTTEFRRVTKAMNQLSDKVQAMLAKESEKLALLHRDSLLDQLTELSNRAHFMNLLDEMLGNENHENRGILILCRVLHLQEMNSFYGRQSVDEILKEIATALHYFCEQYPQSQAGRLNGSDFVIAIPTQESSEIISTDLIQRLNFQLLAQNHNVGLPMAVVQYQHQDDRQTLLHQLDGALAQAELKGDRAVIICKNYIPGPHRNLNDWRIQLETALAGNQLDLAQFPVKNAAGEILHYEAPARLHIDDEEKPAGYFIPWAARLNLLSVIDLAVVKQALKILSAQGKPLAINISNQVFNDFGFRQELIDLLKEKKPSHDLWIEFSEIAIIRHTEAFRSLVESLRQLGCKVGLEHVGLEFTHFEELQDIGLHYVKIDAAITRDIDKNPANQSFIQTLCQIGHSLGIILIAEGVSTEEERSALIRTGLDAFTGPFIK